MCVCVKPEWQLDGGTEEVEEVWEGGGPGEGDARRRGALADEKERKRERSTQGDRVLFSSVGLWEGFLGV